MEDFDKFPNHYIDDISEDVADNYFTPVIKDVLSTISPVKVCDIGCGNGVFSYQIKLFSGSELTGVDGSTYALDKAKELGFDSTHLVKDFSIDPLPVKDEVFDLVVCKDVLEHILMPEHLIAEISRITVPGGHILLHVPNHFPIWARIKFLFDNNIDTFGYFPDAERWEFPHIRFYTDLSLRKLFDQHELAVERPLSSFFSCIPGVSRFIPQSLLSKVANNWPDNFSEGFTYLLVKGPK